MNEIFIRTEKLIGSDELNKLSKKLVVIFGLGGVGGYVLEALTRAGIEHFILIDFDKIEASNLNRQIITNINNIGKYKSDEARERVLSINKNASVISINKKLVSSITEQSDNIITISEIETLINDFDYKDIFIVDAIDDKYGKLEIIKFASKNSINIISCMGTARKLNSSNFKICDIYKTTVCPLAKIMREMLRKENINKLTVLYSDEEPIIKEKGVISYMPAIAGLMIAEYVIKSMIE